MSAAAGRCAPWRGGPGLLALLLVAGACSGPSVSRDDGALVLSPPTEEVAPSRAAAAARIATRYLGAPYVWGGAGPGGFDCSGLVTHVFARVGVSIPHNAAQQYQYGTAVSRAQLEPGDLVFFNRLHHNGIYLGRGRFIHATKPGGVKISKLDDDWFMSRWVGARRL
jgi:cell wall-associated NlpC family hydrolase